MILKSVRKWFTAKTTISEVYVNEVFECYFLEDVFRPGDIFQVKVKGQTAIPRGTYQVIIDDSVRFKRRMPHILNVPNFEGVRIHAGNTAEDTEGCLLTGTRRDVDYVGQSRDAFDKLFAKIEQAQLSGEKILLTIVHEEEVAV